MFTATSFLTYAVDFPKDYKSWTSATTPLSKIGALPGCDADVSTLPAIYRETVKKYCSIKPGGPGKVAILVKPSVTANYKSRSASGKFPDGSNMILHLKDLKVLFVTAHKDNQPEYAVFKEDGTEITKPSGNLSAQACITCHTGYQAFCVNGQCGQFK